MATNNATVNFPPSANAEWFRVNERDCDCNWCGYPFGIGDKVLEVFEMPYCSKRCAVEHYNYKPPITKGT